MFIYIKYFKKIVSPRNILKISEYNDPSTSYIQFQKSPLKIFEQYFKR